MRSRTDLANFNDKRLLNFQGGVILAKHDFGIIDCFETDQWYSEYRPDKYNCVSVDDDIMEEIVAQYGEELTAVKTYFQSAAQPGAGLDYCGVTLIPPESLKAFRDVIVKANSHYQSPELDSLAEKIADAMRKNKYLIHYGI